MSCNYKIVEHDLVQNTETTLLQVNNTEIRFANIMPMGRANHVLTIYGSMFENDETLLNSYDGSFSFSTSSTGFTTEQAETTDELFNTLLECETDNKVISIYVQVVSGNLITDFTPILSKARVALTVKSLKSEPNNVIGLLNVVYKNIN